MAYHFIGIKGTGMAALACILHDEHYEVTGSDIAKYIFTQDRLEERNIPFTTFDPANIKDGDTVIIGNAFDESNPEVKAALANPTVKTYYYFEFLGKFMESYDSISIAGTHGKSTTTGILGSMLHDLDKTGYLIGDGHGYMPEGAKYFVVESCEFQRHFLNYHPDYAIITNIDLDHTDYYKDLDDYISAFQSFVDQIRKKAVVFGDDPHLTKLHYNVPYVTYGLKDGNDYQAVNVEQGPFGMRFDIKHKGKILAHAELPEAGDPFLQDALGCFAMAHELGMPADDIVEGLKNFKGISRRSVIEEIGENVLIDDYAHHPTAIRYMIDMARKKFPGKKIVALYKPDRYSRLQDFLQGFADSLNTADQVCLCDFPKNAVRENENVTVTIDDLMNLCPGAKLLDIDDVSAKILYDMQPAVYVFMSSKDIYLLKDKLKALFEED
ncbi:UDP-N-acetylmuramate--L-alanine ligase [Catenisphaera adipataccumulans]|uniref:UDP-N-acetylmuramate--alanine ligase n=1 Tax=Catenisphaera adipataccumulans TaxID=700500 RepID=A0A7W8CX17_9FIRM|nr:Mur ligase family protein [Catenisphaera adipataccumulans]MBB5183186.1 UDP-N-acetylmuramate--alanine ligase [Catenisphaera adipataccumulans]